jgi:hypothetical protein
MENGETIIIWIEQPMTLTSNMAASAFLEVSFLRFIGIIFLLVTLTSHSYSRMLSFMNKFELFSVTTFTAKLLKSSTSELKSNQMGSTDRPSPNST